MINSFFTNSGPYNLSDIIKLLNIKIEISEDIKINNIKDLNSANEGDITFFHSKKYQELAKTTKASFCITTSLLKDYLPNSCKSIEVENVLIST